MSKSIKLSWQDVQEIAVGNPKLAAFLEQLNVKNPAEEVFLLALQPSDLEKRARLRERIVTTICRRKWIALQEIASIHGLSHRQAMHHVGILCSVVRIAQTTIETKKGTFFYYHLPDMKEEDIQRKVLQIKMEANRFYTFTEGE